MRRARPVAPSGIQVRYFAELLAMVRFAHQLVADRLISRLDAILEHGAAIRDSVHLDASPPRRVNQIMEDIAAAWDRRYPLKRLEALGERIARATSEHQKVQLQRQVQSATGVDLQSIADRGLSKRIAQFTAENVALIRSIPATYFGEVEKRVLSGVSDGLRAGDIAADLEDQLGVAESSAKLIARDQVLSFQADLNEARQQELGVEEYDWRTAGDGRVRPEHRERNGQRYRWDDPPGDESDPGDGANPGDGILCRCWADPVFPSPD